MNEDGAQAPVIRVLVVAEHDLFRTGLASQLGAHADIEVVAHASGGRMGVQLASELRPDVVLMDLPMPDLEVREAIRAILELSPATRVLALTMLPSEEDVADALQAGASGLLARDTPINDILAAVRAAAGGSAWLSPRTADLMLEGLRRADPDREPDSPKLDRLSPRELRSPALDRSWAGERRDRRGPQHQSADGQGLYLEHPREARSPTWGWLTPPATTPTSTRSRSGSHDRGM